MLLPSQNTSGIHPKTDLQAHKKAPGFPDALHCTDELHL